MFLFFSNTHKSCGVGVGFVADVAVGVDAFVVMPSLMMLMKIVILMFDAFKKEEVRPRALLLSMRLPTANRYTSSVLLPPTGNERFLLRQAASRLAVLRQKEK